jgi:hypothetical protein
MKRWYLFLIPVLVGLGILTYFAVRWIAPAIFSDGVGGDNRAKHAQSEAGKTSDGHAVPREVLKLRYEQQLRSLTEREDGIKLQDVPNGVYGFAMCDVAALKAKRDNTFSLEIHKHGGIVYYVGYASEEDIEKYLTRQKNFHILTSSQSRDGASSLFEIPVEFVSKCEEHQVKDGYRFDLFVTTIPELHM